MNERGNLLRLLKILRELTQDECEAIRDEALPKVEQVQIEKESIRKQIEELERLPEGGVSRYAVDKEVREVVSQIMKMDRASNEHFHKKIETLKAESEQQTQTRSTLRRVQGAYAKRLSHANWEVYT
tara:strand:- start:489 stop:869 length:381 start_codon:yes stop_codon:yes gene_type:complete